MTKEKTWNVYITWWQKKTGNVYDSWVTQPSCATRLRWLSKRKALSFSNLDPLSCRHITVEQSDKNDRWHCIHPIIKWQDCRVAPRNRYTRGMFVDDFGKISHVTTANEGLRDEAPTFDFMEFFVDLFFTLIGALKQAKHFHYNHP